MCMSGIWLLVRSLKQSHKEAQKKPLLCEDYSDLTSPTSNQILNIHNSTLFLLNMTLIKIIFHACMFILFNSSF